MTRSPSFSARSTADQVLAGIDLSRKQILITGCDSSIAIETMKALRLNGGRIIGMASTLADAQAACSAAGRSVTALGCDPADARSVDAALEMLRGLGPLDAVVINYRPLDNFADHIAKFVLLNRLAELARQRTGRIVIGSSESRLSAGPIESALFDHLDSERIYDPWAFRGQAKLATTLLAKELSRRLEGRGVTVNAFQSPAESDHAPHEAQSLGLRLIRSLARPFVRTPAQRAATPALLAASPLSAGITGEYWSDCQISPTPPLFSDVGLAKRLWDVFAQMAATTEERAA